MKIIAKQEHNILLLKLAVIEIVGGCPWWKSNRPKTQKI